MKVIIEKRFLRKFRKIDEEWRLRIFDVLKKLENGDLARLDIKKLKGYKNIYRIRVGDFRIKFKKEESLIKVFDVERREKAYR
ncbi:type II toxin-antitoxin system RelE/ParE family toxin [Archaeoglobales archaeon]|nr:MAG: type II toxin-antitoxin system RelE/ParE family toxin [Archaeoglobales archaeon]